MMGYFGDEEATKETIEDGWLHTGDLCSIDKDGYIYIYGRKKSVIVLKNGKNIFPEEMENLVNKIEGIKDIKLVATNDDGTKHYCIESEGEKDLRKTIFAEFAKENITIYEMKKQDVTLEDAFIELIEGGKK